MTHRNKWKRNYNHHICQESSFDTFISVNSNQLAYDAARKLASKSAPIPHGPLLIYGDIGYGKTHLLQAIANHAQVADANICYTSAEIFTTEFIKAIEEMQNDAFRDFYRSCDLLLLDDIDYLGGKTHTEREITFTLKYLFLNQTPIAMTSTVHPSKIDGLSDQLVSLFQQGLIVPIEPPNHNERIIILQKKAEALKLDIDPAFIEYLSLHSDGDIRKMEAKLNQITFLKHQKTKGGEISLIL